MKAHRTLLIALATATILALPHAAIACTACYGGANSAVTKAMTFGILFMVGLTLSVLSAIAGFAFYLWKRARQFERPHGRSRQQ